MQAGDAYTYTLPDDIKVSDGFTVHLALSNYACAYDYSFAGRELIITSTGTIVAGLYQATLFETDETVRNKIEQTLLTVMPDYTAVSTKSKSELRLELLEAEITRRETGGEASYNAANVSITKIDYTALCDERDKLQERVWAEKAQKARSLGIQTKIPFRFTR